MTTLAEVLLKAPSNYLSGLALTRRLLYVPQGLHRHERVAGHPKGMADPDLAPRVKTRHRELTALKGSCMDLHARVL